MWIKFNFEKILCSLMKVVFEGIIVALVFFALVRVFV